MNASVSLPATAGQRDRYRVEPHPFHPRLRHVVIDEDALEEFFRMAAGTDVQELEYVPFMRFALADLLAACAGDSLPATLDGLVRERETGGFTIGVRGVRQDPESFVKFGTAVGHLLGPTNHDSMSGSFYARFLVKDTDTSDSYLRQAYRLFTLHTDGTFVDEATDWLLMMKFAEEHATGGESRLLHIDDWAERGTFENDPRGRTPFAYKAPGSKNVAQDVERPLFFDTRFGLSISFIDQFVQPRTRDEAMFLKALSASMEASSGTIETPLPIGELVVINNYFWLHGRAPFRKDPQLHRELMRQRGMFAT